ncbi:MAG: glutamine--tRNA ligase/YqeY domain fusion protein [Planctomycetota bacterium]|nr:glutamine--tRNA ligase/YqeY domain fusion protein [Planctomycetota bacterium]
MTSEAVQDSGDSQPLDFVRSIVAQDVADGKNDSRVHTRFPPEPNGYLHIGHAKSICLNFGIAAENEGGKCNLRFDDTNPGVEDVEYVESIQEDVKWLGFDWQDRLFFASDYFEQLYEFATQLIQSGDAYIDSLNAEEIRAYRGSVHDVGRNSPDRDRSVEENLDLFQRMRAGEFEDGKFVLRAKIDMSHSNINMRDPTIYRIRHEHHHRTGDSWCIYPMYDFAHGLSDSIEGITHSICTLEFENHRPLYDWFLQRLGVHHPQQIEFARLNVTHTMMSKRKLLELVRDKVVDGWDDPRMPTISGMRRKGYTAEAIRTFCERVGVAKFNSIHEVQLLDFCLREVLNKRASRAMAVLNPLRVVIENFPEDQVDELEAVNNPEDESAGTRTVPFSRVLYIERQDFLEDPPKKFFRLSVGREVRLRYAYFVTCTEVIKDAAGAVVELRCTYDPATRGGSAPDGRKVKGTLQGVSAAHALDAEVRLYENLYSTEDPLDPAGGEDGRGNLNPNSLTIQTGCKLEPSLAQAKPGENFQFERVGYFCVDAHDSKTDRLVMNRTVALRDSWAKAQKKG